MKNIKTVLFWLTLLVGSQLVLASSPFGEVNTKEFEFSMTFTGIVKIDSIETRDTSDRLAAYAGTELRGVVKPFYVDATDRYYFLLLVYGNTPNEDITFKYYDADEDQVIELSNLVPFEVNEARGTFSEPYIFSNIEALIGLQDASEVGILIYPQPASHFLLVDSPNEITSLQVINLNGRVLIQENTVTKLDISSLQKGVYFIRITDYRGEFVERFLLE